MPILVTILPNGARLKTSRVNVEKNRENLLSAASRGFRRKGFEGVKVAELMQEVGLTHGAFYNYFKSKDDLVASACDASLKHQSDRVRGMKTTSSKEAGTELTAYIECYLSQASRDTPESACLFPSLAADVSRQGEAVRTAFSEGLHDYLDAMGDLTDPGRPENGLPHNAVALLSTLVGAMVLARAVNDPQLSDGILYAARQSLTRRFER
jgi:TetR/AcrR family transcriptional regulator, transcriptional repressor for nem operon